MLCGLVMAPDISFYDLQTLQVFEVVHLAIQMGTGENRLPHDNGPGAAAINGNACENSLYEFFVQAALSEQVQKMVCVAAPDVDASTACQVCF